MVLNTIEAIDEVGNTYTKEVTLLSTPEDVVVSLGGNCRWYYSDIIKPLNNSQDRLYLDAIGRNHKGYPVWCSYSELLNILSPAV